MIVWVEKPLVLAIHDRQIAEHGGSAGTRDEGLLESALASGIARNPPFLDGNKCTAHVAYRTFLALNGADLDATDEDKYVTMLALAEGKLAERDFAAWLRARLQFAPRGEAHEPRKTYRVKPRRARRSGARARVTS